VARPVQGEAGLWDFLWDPTDPPEGNYTAMVRMLSEGTPVATTSSPFAVNINVAPILDDIAPQSVEENSLLTFDVVASDGDGDPLVLSAAGVPAGATFTDHGDGTGTFSWTPTTGDRGSYSVTFTADDGELNDTTTAAITVFEEELPPVLDPVDDVSVAEGDTLVVTFTGSDVNGDTLSLSVTPLPGAATLTKTGPGSWTLTWTPGFNQHGSYPMTATLTDGQFQVSDPFTVTVTDVDVPPTFTNLRDQMALVNADSMSYVDAQDFDGDVIALDATGLPTWATFEDLGSGRGRFAYAPPASASGQTWTVTVTASTATLDTTATFTLTAFGFMRLEVSPAQGGVYDAAPGVEKTLKATIRNTGNAAGNVTFEAVAARGDWDTTDPGDIWLEPGASTQVSFTVTAGPTGSSSAVTLTAAATEFTNTQAVGNFQVRIPVQLVVAMTATSAAFGSEGVVTATFLDGSPAAGVQITVTDRHQLGAPFVNTATGPTAADGTFAFRFDTDSEGGNLPGGHTLSVTGVRDGRTDTTAGAYTVLV